MAVIEYKISVNANGVAVVTQDVLLIEPTDKIRFNADPATKNLAIRFPTASPFNNPGIGVIFPVASIAPGTPPTVGTIPVVTSNDPPLALRFVPHFQENRRTFHFECGQVVGGAFSSWGGQGGDTPDGGHA